MPKDRDHKVVKLHTRTWRRLKDLSKGKTFDKFLNELLDIYVSKSSPGEQLPVDTNKSKDYDYPPCPYRTLLKDGNILCEEKHKIPLIACITRQKRYIAMERKCRPVGRPRPARRRRRTAPQADKDHYCALQGIHVSTEELPLPKCVSCPNKACLEGLRSQL